MNQITPQWRRRWACTLALATLCATTAQAQSTPDAPTTAALPYRSVFDGYQKFNDQSLASWTQTNATVEAIGGWRTYAKEAMQADAPASAKNAPMAKPKSGVHDAHGGQP